MRLMPQHWSATGAIPPHSSKNLVSPYTGKPYELIEAEKQFIRFAFRRDANGRLQFPLWMFGAPKKSRKSELANLLTITTVLLFGGKYAEAYLVAARFRSGRRPWAKRLPTHL
jgi:hypothetical protein